MHDPKLVLVSCPVVFREDKGGYSWFIVRQNEDSVWEVPKTVVRKGESSVRASIRAMGEQGGMNAKVLEEVGRGGGATKVGGRAVSQRFIYYLLVYRGGAEVLGYTEHDWLPYAKAVRKLATRRDQQMLREANKMSKTVDLREEEEPVDSEE